jgi:hypothetical protein
LTIQHHTDNKLPPIRLEKCEDVVLRNVTIQSSDFADKPINNVKSERVEVHGLVAAQ